MKNLEKLMASLNEKFKSTKGSTTASSFLEIKPTEISKGAKVKFQDQANPNPDERGKPVFPRMPRVKAVNLILAFAGFNDQVQDLLTRLSKNTR